MTLNACRLYGEPNSPRILLALEDATCGSYAERLFSKKFAKEKKKRWLKENPIVQPGCAGKPKI